MRRAPLAIALAAALISAVAVYQGHDQLAVFAVYLASVVSIVLALSERPPLRLPRLDRRRLVGALPVLLLVFVQLGLATYYGSFPQHFQHDEFITAYISYALPDLPRIHWFAGYPGTGFPERDSWVAQFPILFFALQKPFFMLLGPTVEAVRISVWPYLALTTVYLYLIALELSHRPAFAFLAGLAAIVFAPSLYLTSIGVHFHSSTLFFVAASYHLLRLLRTERRLHAVASGLFAAFAYLTYASSYVTLPLLLGYVVFESAARRSSRPLKLFLPSLAVFGFVMLPFVASTLAGSTYLLERTEQVSALIGRGYGVSAVDRGSQAGAFLAWQLAENLRSLYEPGHVALTTGYLFGDQAFFAPLGLGLFALGVLVGLYRVFLRGERAYVLVIAALLLAFVSGMVLTMPAGGFHRVSLAYPFVGLTIALGASVPAALAKARLSDRRFARAVGRLGTAALVAAFCLVSLSRASGMVYPDQTHDSPTLARYLEERVPADDTVGIAFAANYHLGRELFFRTGGRQFVTGSVEDILDHPPSDVIVLAYASDPVLAEVRERFPGAKLVDVVDGIALHDHYIVLTDGQQAAAR